MQHESLIFSFVKKMRDENSLSDAPCRSTIFICWALNCSLKSSKHLNVLYAQKSNEREQLRLRSARYPFHTTGCLVSKHC